MSGGEKSNLKGNNEMAELEKLVVHEDGTVELDRASRILFRMNELLKRRQFLCGDTPTTMDEIVIFKLRPLLEEMTAYDRALHRHLTRWVRVMLKRLSNDNA
ncbi:uncharacterized protein LOC106670449 [Cimex lectularius]|uniref:Nuclear-export cofactor Arc1-like N-terminal domain-containing protein n=1 Tax=Cimex lectularius TaxID=79782 RepID=A0A8I6S514_CIMLE|nr:uncharacterized protein LOC106670449 [Cimex lectularius]